MKKYIKALPVFFGTLTTLWGISYLGTSYIVADFDITKWSDWARNISAFMLFMSVIFSAALYGAYLTFNQEE